MMCSAFVANSLKVGLSSIWPEINSHEFTPKDVYQLQIFNDGRSEHPRFDNVSCAGGLILDEAGNGAYCQLLGPYRLPLNEYNTVKLTAHMNEHCAAQWPNFAFCGVLVLPMSPLVVLSACSSAGGRDIPPCLLPMGQNNGAVWRRRGPSGTRPSGKSASRLIPLARG